MELRKTGYGKKALLSNIALGIFDGIDSALWCYAFATIIFTSTLNVFLPVGLAIMLGGWALLGITIALTSKAYVHMVDIDEQAVVIIGSIALLLVSSFGDEAASPRGLATILAVMSLISLIVAFSFFLASRFQLSRLLELLPYPVICGFMAGIAWLLLDAGVMVALDTSISIQLWQTLQTGNNFFKLLLCVVGGIFLLIFTSRIEKAWSLPLASVSLIIAFYGFSGLAGYNITGLRSDGWMFDINTPEGGVLELLSYISFSDVDIDFILSVIPQIVTIIFLTMLSASMNLSALSAINLKANMNSSDELKGMSGGNFLCALIASPPGSTDAPASILYNGFGASTRWMPLASSFVCLLVAVSGDWLISYTPKVLIGATIFLFAFQLFYDWMYANVRNFSLQDYAIVCFILLTVIMLDFMQGIMVGIILTVLVFVLRYSMITAIQDQYSLNDHRSSVERSAFANKTLDKYGAEAMVYTLRGFLFFGTANTIRETIRENLESGSFTSILLDLRRVTGIDISAMNAFSQIKQICDIHGIQLLYACYETQTADKLTKLDAVSYFDGKPQIFPEADFALEKMEDRLLAKHTDQAYRGSIRHHLIGLLASEKKAQVLLDVMVREIYRSGEFLFRQGDPDTGFYILKSGSMTAMIHSGKGHDQRVKKFFPGSVIGEMSRYTIGKKRTASVVADSSSVLYYLNPDKLEDMSVVHELVARTMGVRIEHMNRRLMWELV